ncbi:hypothetical protein SMKI_02G2590 [Saccharomyces mikatae IFO 1815]|uniref:NADP-dependent oxidoreductase domain-containing protein n=1 Tax=Saccharomyces mikatae IFO 1815 TaxID=226126 RepID=A0AA35NF62_SACMI|nr:uncharacterized protein SMKI_02G2590 [Saccharomyces mikatae IFO 1815]CAI4037384.1 hypothetical protein SMKI_02G2590 [Saccharomyces mikatae IFO 1815]
MSSTTASTESIVDKMLHPKTTEIYFSLNNGVRIPALGLGTANPQEKLAETKQAVKAAIKAGYRHIDTAWAYRTEPFVGEAIKELLEEGTIKREDLFITTKVWPVLWDEVDRSLNESLKALGLDYVDLLLQHWPICFGKVKDPEGISGYMKLPVDDSGKTVYASNGDWLETYKQLEKIYLDSNDHRVRAIGVSNFSIEYLERLIKECKVKPTVNQVESHPHLPQVELRKFCFMHDILLTAYSPLGSQGAPNLKIPLVKKLCEKYNVTGNDLLISYHIRQGTIVIPRSLNPVRISSNIEFVCLTKDELQELNEFGEKYPVRFMDVPSVAILPGFTGKGPNLDNLKY